MKNSVWKPEEGSKTSQIKISICGLLLQHHKANKCFPQVEYVGNSPLKLWDGPILCCYQMQTQDNPD